MPTPKREVEKHKLPTATAGSDFYKADHLGRSGDTDTPPGLSNTKSLLAQFPHPKNFHIDAFQNLFVEKTQLVLPLVHQKRFLFVWFLFSDFFFLVKYN